MHRRLRAVLRTFAHLGVVLLLIATLVTGTCLGCIPVKAGGCCDPSGHCKKVSRTCDYPHSALLTVQAPPVSLPVTSLAMVPAPQAVSADPGPAIVPERPPDLPLRI